MSSSCLAYPPVTATTGLGSIRIRTNSIVMMMNRLTMNSPIRLHTYFNIGSILLLSGITLQNNSPQAARAVLFPPDGSAFAPEHD